MGGNTQAIDRDTGKLKTLSDGTPARAEQIPITPINRGEIRRVVLDVLTRLDDNFRSQNGHSLWSSLEILRSAEAFNGSSRHLFDLSRSSHDLSMYKPTMGDIDVMVSNHDLPALFELLTFLEGERLTPETVYVGQNKKKLNGNQINALFRIDLSAVGHGEMSIQIDFEGSEFVNGVPSDFSKFSHSSSWRDLEVGLKGVAHKYWLTNLTRVLTRDHSIVLLTPTSTYDKPKISKKATFVPSRYAFSVGLGLRPKLEIVTGPDGSPLRIRDQVAVKEIKASDNSHDAIRDPKLMFETLFKVPPTKSELQDFHSFLGLLELTKKYVDEELIDDVFVSLVSKNLYGKEAQKLSRNSSEADMKTKESMLNQIYETFPFLSDHRKKWAATAARVFYRSYSDA